MEKTEFTKEASESYFDGKLIQQIGWYILCYFITFFSLGIAFPWAYCLLLSWETKHTIVNGRRLKFDGTGAQLFGNWIKWLLLIIITLGIYSLWVDIEMKRWKVKHIHFDQE